MKVLWTNSPLSASEIIAALSHTEDWHPNTIKTMLSRLHKKKVVGVEKQKNLYLYRPLVSEADCVRTESESFLKRVFGGAVKPLLMHFAQQRKLSTEDLEELRESFEAKAEISGARRFYQKARERILGNGGESPVSAGKILKGRQPVSGDSLQPGGNFPISQPTRNEIRAIISLPKPCCSRFRISLRR